LTVDFVADGTPMWRPPNDGTTDNSADGSGERTGGTRLLADPLEFPFPVVDLPYATRTRAFGARLRFAVRRLLARVPRRSARQLVESAAALGLLAVLSPVFVAAAVAIKVTSRGPVFFRQPRVGLHREPFTIFKFRTMYVDNDDGEHRRLMREQLTAESPPDGGKPGIYKIVDDPRITPVGDFLRQFSIDELPQLWNVLRGEMSLVGPRPYVPWEAELFPADVEKRFGVRPGMTGLWQVSGRSTVDFRTALHIDVFYAEHKSLWLDLRILARTVVIIFDRSLTR
jgi:lipopolysaccharide/colanic/teichoic acid biosynthesis glycosyltransferase